MAYRLKICFSRQLFDKVRQEMSEWFGPVVETWRHIKTQRIVHALPEQSPPISDPASGTPSKKGGYMSVANMIAFRRFSGPCFPDVKLPSKSSAILEGFVNGYTLYVDGIMFVALRFQERRRTCQKKRKKISG